MVTHLQWHFLEGPLETGSYSGRDKYRRPARVPSPSILLRAPPRCAHGSGLASLFPHGSPDWSILPLDLASVVCRPHCPTGTMGWGGGGKAYRHFVCVCTKFAVPVGVLC